MAQMNFRHTMAQGVRSTNGTMGCQVPLCGFLGRGDVPRAQPDGHRDGARDVADAERPETGR